MQCASSFMLTLSDKSFSLLSSLRRIGFQKIFHSSQEDNNVTDA